MNSIGGLLRYVGPRQLTQNVGSSLRCVSAQWLRSRSRVVFDIKVTDGGGATLEHGSIAVNENRWLLGIWSVNFGKFTSTLAEVKS